jgi:hypothetical protein
MKIKLTVIQQSLLISLIEQKKQAENELNSHLLVLIGKKFTKYKIENGELDVDVIEDKPNDSK